MLDERALRVFPLLFGPHGRHMVGDIERLAVGFTLPVRVLFMLIGETP